MAVGPIGYLILAVREATGRLTNFLRDQESKNNHPEDNLENFIPASHFTTPFAGEVANRLYTHEQLNYPKLPDRICPRAQKRVVFR